MTDKHEKPGFWAVVMSVLSSAFGVQSQKNYQRDFKGGTLPVYIAVGVVFVVLFIAGLMLLVNTIIS